MSSFLERLKDDRAFWRKVVSGKRLTKAEQAKLLELKSDFGLGSDGLVDTQEELAVLLGYTSRTISRWKNEGMPVESGGRYDPMRIIEWREDLLDDLDGDEKELSGKGFWDVEFRKFRAQLAELEYRKASGEVIDLAVVEGLLIERATELKKSLLSRAKRIAGLVAHRSADEVYELLEADALDALRSYSRPSPVIEEAKRTAAAIQEDGEGDESVR